MRELDPPYILALAFFLLAAPLVADEREGLELFEKKIRPVLIEHCYQCHSALAKEVKGKLLVDHREGLRKGGESGPAVVPGKPAESLLVEAIRHEGLEMPPDEKLPASVAADFVRWIELGAPDPRDTPATAEQAAQVASAERFEQLRQWWSLQPVGPSPQPSPQRGEGASGIDDFIRARLTAEELLPAERADRRSLIRRLSFTLRGLPPTPGEVEAFLQDDSPDAWPRLVEQYLTSPHFGEHFARHWMDVVRYGDTYGYEWDIPAKGAWRYRDYLTRAFNADVPYNQLVREQIAGDLLPLPSPSPLRGEGNNTSSPSPLRGEGRGERAAHYARISPIDQINESLIGTMFFQMGEKRHGDSAEFDGIHQEMLDNKIDAFSKAFQAITISCARCHDHKIDPILQSEYYALGGMFMSSRWLTNTVDLPERHASYRQTLGEIKRQLRRLLTKAWQDDLDKLTPDVLRASLKGRGDKPPPLEDLLHVWSKLQAAAEAGASVADAWKALAAQYQSEQTSRTAQNAAAFTLVADFRSGVPTGWSIAGVGLQEQTPCGDFTVALEGDAAIGQVLHGGLVTHALSPRMNGAVRTPYTNAMPPGQLSFEVCGGDFAARRAVIDNAFLTEKQQYLNARHPQWIHTDTFASMPQRRIYLEFATKTSNPNFPPRVGLGGECSEQQAADPRSWFGISRVLRSANAATPADELTRFGRLFASGPEASAPGGVPTTLDETAQRYGAAIRAAVDAWSHGKAADDDVRWLNFALDAKWLANSSSAAEIRELVERYRTIERAMPEPWTVNGMADVDPGYDLPLNVRGEYDQPAGIVPRGYVSAIRSVSCQVAPNESHGSGRLQLANMIASKDNPLTARVFVNRVWQWLFGVGIVETSNDFGHLGARPSHPELLDHLAARFVEQGWSVKQLVREIVLSETWQQSSAASERARNVDPANRLLSHFSLRRLEAESIRDAMLAASGELDPRLYGPPIDPHRQNEDPQKRLFSGPVDGHGRRSLYTKLTIMEPPRLLALFNQPPPKIPTGNRDVTSTPAQSLALLNDPFVSQQAEAWARRLTRQQHASVQDRVAAMFLTAYGREPTPRETDRWAQLIGDLSQQRGLAADQILQDLSVWKEAAHALLNTKEFIYLR